jgi:hypothetical protein
MLPSMGVLDATQDQWFDINIASEKDKCSARVALLDVKRKSELLRIT